ncbi:MAG: beta-ketoacyl-ACP synthase II [Bacteroidales bacterium]|nr:beta-ketoacyl-ACP synthase II [Bacteroidales bacterium]
MELKRVVVTGLGAITPIGNSVNDFWESLINGVSGSGPVTCFNPEKHKTQFACQIKNYHSEDYFDKKEVNRYDLFEQYALIAARQAIEDAHFELDKENLNRFGVIWGSGVGGVHSFADEVKNFHDGGETPRFSPFFVPKMICDMPAGYISIQYGFRGPNFGTVSACASSNNAMCNAVNLIRLGKADVFVCGGSEASITQEGVGGFNAMRALSTRNDDPARASRPFSNSRDGFVMGEGAGCLILEEMEHALARGARIYAELAGTGMSADAYHMTAPHPEGLGARMVMEEAMAEGGILPEEVDYINTHGTSTKPGDISEAKAIVSTFGQHAYEMNISSTKSMTGHLLGAAGAIEAVATTLAVYYGIVPPTINHEEGDDDPEIDSRLNFTFNKACRREIKVALSNTFGFGGHNACVAFKKWK